MKSNRTAKHVVFISYDAFSQDNFNKAKKLPNLSKLIKNGIYTSNLNSVYPTLTYVVHSTLVTGVYPDKHGVIHNTPFQPFIEEKNQEWYWFRDNIKAPTIYDAIKDAKMTTAGIMWPVTGKSSIKYNLPEIVAINDENQMLKIVKNGSPLFTIAMGLKYGKTLQGINQPYLDNFSTLSAMDTIKNKRPNLLLLHLIDLDDSKHNYGTDSKEVDAVIKRMDKRIGGIIKSVEDAGIYDDTVFIISGDHGQINVNYKVHLNNLLKENSLIYEENGELKWRAYLQTGGGSAYLHIKDNDKEAERLALEILYESMNSGKYGIERIIAREELEGLHVHESIKYMVEAKVTYSFEESLSAVTIEDLKKQGIKHANHGYLPDKDNYKCNLVISGNIIKSDHEIGRVNMVDIAPTIGRILGVDFPNSDGRALEEIFV